MWTDNIDTFYAAFLPADLLAPAHSGSGHTEQRDACVAVLGLLAAEHSAAAAVAAVVAAAGYCDC